MRKNLYFLLTLNTTFSQQDGCCSEITNSLKKCYRNHKRDCNFQTFFSLICHSAYVVGMFLVIFLCFLTIFSLTIDTMSNKFSEDLSKELIRMDLSGTFLYQNDKVYKVSNDTKPDGDAYMMSCSTQGYVDFQDVISFVMTMVLVSMCFIIPYSQSVPSTFFASFKLLLSLGLFILGLVYIGEGYDIIRNLYLDDFYFSFHQSMTVNSNCYYTNNGSSVNMTNLSDMVLEYYKNSTLTNTSSILDSSGALLLNISSKITTTFWDSLSSLLIVQIIVMFIYFINEIFDPRKIEYGIYYTFGKIFN